MAFVPYNPRFPEGRPGVGGPYPSPRLPSRRPSTKKPPKGKGKGKGVSTGFGNINVGFDPMEMARSMANLEYNDTIAALNAKRTETEGGMAAALRDLQAWATGQEKARAAQQMSADTAMNTAVAGAKASDANIANLFGEQAKADAAYGARPGEDFISATGLEGVNYLRAMQPVLGMKGRETQIAAERDYNDQLNAIDAELRATNKDKRAAVNKNYTDMLQLAWGREKSLSDQRLAERAARLAEQSAAANLAGLNMTNKQKQAELDAQKKLLPLELRKQELANIAAEKGNEAARLANQKSQIGLQASKLELKKLRSQLKSGGLDWNNPTTGATIGSAAYKGMIGPRGGFNQNPTVALGAAFARAKAAGWNVSDKRVARALIGAYNAAIQLSHGRGQWTSFNMIPLP